MSRRVLWCCLAVGAGLACSDVPDVPVASNAVQRATAAMEPASPRERLARDLALALADPTARATFKRRLDQSNAPEGKLQFQALAHASQGLLLSTLARRSARSIGDVLEDLDAAQGLETYLPVPSQRAAWRASGNYLVGTIANDGDIPVAFDSAGNRYALSPDAPPSRPVIALVPQETDFSGRPSMEMACEVDCGDPERGGGGGGGGFHPSMQPTVRGIYLTHVHFTGSFESWLKGAPEYEFHVYSQEKGKTSEQIACTGEHAGYPYQWDQNDLDWNGSALLLSDDDYAAYQRAHPGAPVRIMAWEDDNTACVDTDNPTSLKDQLDIIDKNFNSMTSATKKSGIFGDFSAAKSLFNVFQVAYNIILTNDDFIGNAVATSVGGPAPNGANWWLKGDGATTTGWFTAVHR